MKDNRTPQNTIILESITHTKTNDLDLGLYYDILGNDNVETAYNEKGVETIHKGDYYDSYPVKIEDLKNAIKEAEEKGCNYMALDYNCDHPDFTFIGIHAHSPSEAEMEEIKQKQIKEKMDEANRLIEEADRLRQKAEQIKKQ